MTKGWPLLGFVVGAASLTLLGLLVLSPAHKAGLTGNGPDEIATESSRQSFVQATADSLQPGWIAWIVGACLGVAAGFGLVGPLIGRRFAKELEAGK